MTAYALGLDYAISAGIITLLSLQDTKKATISLALIRTGAFALSIMILFMVFYFLSFTPIAFGVFLMVFASICYYFKIYDAIPMNAVLATHFLLEKEISFSMIRNEALLLVIGAGIGILLNIYIPNNEKQIRREQRKIEADLKVILSEMAEQLLIQNKCDYNEQSLDKLKEHIEMGLKHAYTNMNNTFFQESRYYIEYMDMRNQQYNILKEIYEKIRTLTTVTTHSDDMAMFIRSISETLSESQNTKDLLRTQEALLVKFKESSLPVTRDEFENRAVLYIILMDIRIFLKMKERFVDSLTMEQKERYWKKEL